MPRFFVLRAFVFPHLLLTFRASAAGSPAVLRRVSLLPEPRIAMLMEDSDPVVREVREVSDDHS